jgi:hypothetical protein
MCDPTLIVGSMIVGSLATASGAQKQAKADKQSLQAQAAIERHNAEVAEWQAKDAIARGQVAQNQQRLKTASIAGTQRARFAARGLAVDEGSPLNILLDTEFMGELDARTIADNSEKEAWALREGAQNASANASLLQNRAGAISPSSTFFTSLLGSAGSVASSWYTMSKAGSKTT